jgi:glycosyltransferase involved in cell wall biosynthesis
MEASTVTGPAKNLIRFAQENRQVDVRIFTFVRGGAHGPNATNPFIDAARTARLPVEVIPERRRFDLGVLAHLRQRFAAWQPEVVQTHSVKSHFLMALMGRPRPWITFHHGYTNENLKMRAYNALDRYSLRHSDRTVTVCEAFVPALARCGVARNRVDILHNSVDPAWGAVPEEIEALRTSMNLTPGVVRILAVGRLSQEKGHAILIEAAGDVKRQRPDLAFEVLLAGDGPLRDKLVVLAKTQGVEIIVRFVGQVKNVKAFFGVADLAVLPSFSEGSPNVVLEAMAAHVPLIATSVGGVPEILQDRETALLVPPGNPAAMASAMAEMIDNRELRLRLADRAREHVTAEFTTARYDARLLAVYEKALAAPRRS